MSEVPLTSELLKKLQVALGYIFSCESVISPWHTYILPIYIPISTKPQLAKHRQTHLELAMKLLPRPPSQSYSRPAIGKCPDDGSSPGFPKPHALSDMSHV